MRVRERVRTSPAYVTVISWLFCWGRGTRGARMDHEGHKDAGGAQSCRTAVLSHIAVSHCARFVGEVKEKLSRFALEEEEEVTDDE